MIPKGFTKMGVVALVVCILSFLVMLGVGCYYYLKSKEITTRISQHAKQGERLYFWEYSPIPIIETQDYAREAMMSLEAFMRAGNIAEKAAAVSNGYGNIGKMTTYYMDHPFEIIPRSPALTKIGMLKVHGRDCLMIIVNFKNKTHWELNFYRDSDNKWKLDWPAFVRYQSTNWERFIHGPENFPDGAEFRVWVMRERAEEDNNNYAIRFIEPPSNGSSRRGVVSPPVLVEKNSMIGKKLYRYLRINELQAPSYKVLSGNDDDNYMRVRAIITKEDAVGLPKKVFKLKDIVSEGWYDDPPSL